MVDGAAVDAAAVDVDVVDAVVDAAVVAVVVVVGVDDDVGVGWDVDAVNHQVEMAVVGEDGREVVDDDGDDVGGVLVAAVVAVDVAVVEEAVDDDVDVGDVFDDGPWAVDYLFECGVLKQIGW